MLARTLPPLLAQDFPSEDYEIIVVVDGSTDGTTDLLWGFASHSNLRVIEQQNRGQAAAINAGLRTAKGELVLFLDDDILCGPSVVSEHARAVRSELTCLAFGPVLVSPDDGDPLAVDWARSFCDEFFEKKAAEEPETGWFGCMASANSSAPRSVILSIGGLDESFSRGNDVELGFRLMRAGFRFSYLPNAELIRFSQRNRAMWLRMLARKATPRSGLAECFPSCGLLRVSEVYRPNLGGSSRSREQSLRRRSPLSPW